MSNFKLKYLDSLLESDYIISPQKVVNDLWGSNAQEKMEFSYDAQEKTTTKVYVQCPRENGVFFFRKISSN